MDRVIPSETSLGRAGTPEFWLELNPALHVTDRPLTRMGADFAIEAERSARAAERIRIEGYAQLQPLIPRAETQPVARAVRRVLAAGFPGPLTVVYDEVWSLFARLAKVLQPILGPGYRLFPDLWVWCVDGDGEKAGWSIHRDEEMDRWSLAEDGTPRLVTVWIPLTDATLDNSCIYVLPTHRDPNYPQRLDCWTIPQGAEADVRALPAAAGSVLIWNQYLLHWGSRYNRCAEGPRISLATYAQSMAVEPFAARPPAAHLEADDTPAPGLVDLSRPLTFEDRLGIAGRMVWKYRRLAPCPRSVLEFCEECAKRYLQRVGAVGYSS